MAETQAPVLETKKLGITFGGLKAVQNFNFQIHQGELVGLIGPNGAGKTTVFNMLTGVYVPTEGTVLVNGQRVGVDVDFPPDLGLIIETPGFLPQYSGMKNLEILAALNKKIGLLEIADAIRRVGLDPMLKKPVGKYSLGMRQRLGIAQAIMEDPSLLILDEPLNGLDKHGVREMRELRRLTEGYYTRPRDGTYTAAHWYAPRRDSLE